MDPAEDKQKKAQVSTKTKVKVKSIVIMLAIIVGVIWIAVMTVPFKEIGSLASGGSPPQGCVDKRYPYTCGNYCCKNKKQCKGWTNPTKRCSPNSQSECDAGETLCTAGNAKSSCCPSGTTCTKTQIWGKWISVCAKDKEPGDEDCGVVPESKPPVRHYCKPGECSTIPDTGDPAIPICKPGSCPGGEKCSGGGVTICCPTGACYKQPGGAPACDTSAPPEIPPIGPKPDSDE